MNRLLSLPLLVVAVTNGWMSKNFLFAGSVGAITLGRALMRQGVPLTRTAQRAAVLGAGIITALALNSTLTARAPRIHTVLSPGGQVVAGAFLVAAVVHSCSKNPFGGTWFTLALGVVAMTACGRVKSGAVYFTCCAAFTVLGLWTANWRATAPRRPNLRRQLLLLLGALAAASTTAVLVLALPKAQAWALRQAMRRGQDRAAFSDRLWLGSMHGLSQSDTVVMRVRGHPQDLLRGAVYTYYAGGQWQQEPQALAAQGVPNQAPDAPEFTRIEFPSGVSDHYFLPLNATSIGGTPGALRFSAFGILHPVVSELPGEIRFSVDPPGLPLGDPPRPLDQALPPRLQSALKLLALDWTRDARTPRQMLTALEAKLTSEYSYSVEFDVPKRHDPVLYFLRHSRTGHCEYFASGMALLSRSLGVPARVVTGYRVVEYNPLGEYFMVRERDAHAWVEAYLPEHGWQTFDPTPDRELGPGLSRATPFFSAVGDLGRLLSSRFLEWLDRRTWFQVLGALVSLVVLNALVRLRRERKQRRTAALSAHYDPPLPCFEALCHTLKTRGLLRAPSETIEAFARRLSDGNLSQPERARTEQLFMSYVALRFGNRGHATELSEDMESYARQLRLPE